MEDKLTEMEAFSNGSAASNGSLEPTQAIRLAVTDDHSPYDRDLANLLADFRDLQDELAMHTGMRTLDHDDQSRTETREASQASDSAIAGDSPPATLAEINQLQRDLAALLALHDQNDVLRDAVAGVHQESTDHDTSGAEDVKLRIYAPDGEEDDVPESPSIAMLQQVDGKLISQLNQLEQEIVGSEDELAKAQRTINQLLGQNDDPHAETTDASLLRIADFTEEPFEAEAAEPDVSESEVPQPEALTPNLTTNTNVEQIAAENTVETEKDDRIDELVANEKALQEQVDQANNATLKLKSELERLQAETENQQRHHSAELAERETMAEVALRDAVALEKVSAAQEIADRFAEQVALLQATQADQCEKLDARTEQLQARLEAAVVSEAELKAKLESAQVSLQEHRDQVNTLRSQHSDELTCLHGKLAEAESDKALLAHEQLRLQTLAAELKSDRDQSTETVRSLEVKIAAEQQRLQAIAEAAAMERDHAIREAVLVQENLLAEQQRLQIVAKDVAAQKDQTAKDASLLHDKAKAEQERLQTAANEAAAQRDESVHEVAQLKESFAADQQRLETIRQELESKYESATKENEDLRRQLSDLQEQKKNVDSQLQDQTHLLNETQAAATIATETLEQQRDTASKLAEQLAADLDSVRTGHETLQRQCAEQVTEIQSLLNRKSEIEAEEESKSKSLNAQTAELMRISATHQNLAKQSEQQSAQIASLLADNEKHCSDQERNRELIRTKDAQLKELTALQSLLTSQLDQLTSQVRVLVGRYESVRSDDARSRQLLSDQQTEITELNRLYQNACNESLARKTELQGLQAENESLSQQFEATAESLRQKQTELQQLTTQHDAALLIGQQQSERIAELTLEKDQLGEADTLANDTLNKEIADRIREIENLRESHEAIRAQSVEQADKIMRLINENQKLTRADRMRAQELTERKSELVHLRDALDDLKLNSDVQAARIDHLINEKRELIREKTETEALSFANLQAAAADFERLQLQKQTVDDKLLSLQKAESSTETLATPAPTRATSTKKRSTELSDDLTRIEGIGPKIQSLLADSRIRTYRKLANTSIDRLAKILQDGGGHFHMHDPSTWPDQAQLAADGNWKKLVRLQDSLVGGRRA